jgi:hypothetical protein
MFLGIVVDPTGVRPDGGPASWWHELAALHLAAMALFIVIAVAWGRHGRRRILVASAVIIILAVVLTYIGTVGARDIPIEWITIIHEGLGYKSIEHLYTTAVHAGVNFAFVIPTVATEPVPTLHDVVWLNLLLALVNAVLFLHLGLYVTTPVWAVVWTLVLALNPATFQASFSELPTNLLGLYLLAGFIAWATLIDPMPQPRAVRLGAWMLCAILTALVALTRVEVALIGVVALALHALDMLMQPGTWPVVWQRLYKMCERPLAFLSEHPVVVAALCVVGLWLSQAGLPGGLVGRSESAGLYPFNPSFLSLYVFLPMLLLPIGVSIGVFLGFVFATVRFRLFGGLALSLFILIRTYFAGQDQYYETGRYFSFIFPALFLFGLFGKQQLDEMAAGWSPNWSRIARIVFVMAWFTRPPPGAPDFYLRMQYTREAGFAQALLDFNTQREVRHLLAMTEANPQCIFVSRVIANFNERPPEYAYVAFGLPLPAPIRVRESETSLEEFVANYAGDASCVRLYYGGDCNITYTDHCEQFIEGRRLIEEKRFWSRPYGNPNDYGYGEPEIVLATYAWP